MCVEMATKTVCSTCSKLIKTDVRVSRCFGCNAPNPKDCKIGFFRRSGEIKQECADCKKKREDDEARKKRLRK